MEARHVVQRVKAQGLDDTNERYGLYYRFVDPWQVRGHLYYLIVEDMGMNTHNTHTYTHAPQNARTHRWSPTPTAAGEGWAARWGCWPRARWDAWRWSRCGRGRRGIFPSWSGWVRVCVRFLFQFYFGVGVYIGGRAVDPNPNVFLSEPARPYLYQSITTHPRQAPT